ncbi:MAG: hypothetical protein ACFCUV_26005 [Rivularia sp. (in: cyanobacteria)]
MDNNEISELMMAIANKLKTNREENTSKNTNQDSINKTLLIS